MCRTSDADQFEAEDIEMKSRRMKSKKSMKQSRVGRSVKDPLEENDEENERKLRLLIRRNQEIHEKQ